MKALIVLKEFLRLVNEEGLDLSELCEQTDLIEKYVVPELEALQQPKNCDGCKYNRTDEDFHSYVCDDCCRKSVDRYEAKGAMR